MKEIEQMEKKALDRQFKKGLAIGAFTAILLVIIFGAIGG